MKVSFVCCCGKLWNIIT